MKKPRLSTATIAVVLFAFILGASLPARAQTPALQDSCGSRFGLPGDMNEDCHYNLLDVVLLIRAVFGGPDQQYMNAVDVNCDNYVDVFDVIRLADYIFARGPALHPCNK